MQFERATGITLQRLCSWGPLWLVSVADGVWRRGQGRYALPCAMRAAIGAVPNQYKTVPQAVPQPIHVGWQQRRARPRPPARTIRETTLIGCARPRAMRAASGAVPVYTRILKHLFLCASNTSRSHRARTDTRSYPRSTGVSMAGPLHQRCCRTAGGNQAPGLSPAMKAPVPAAAPRVAQEACDHTVRFGGTSAASLCCRSPSAWTRFRASSRATAPDSTGGK